MSELMTRRSLFSRFAGIVAAAAVMPLRSSAQTAVKLVVYKDPSCGCCHKWVEHMQKNGFTATVNDVPDMASIKTLNKVPTALQSCHTTLVGGYVVEGHVPASDVKRLLTEKPKGIVGLTIPGMPASAPGMDLLPFQPYTVLTFDANGKTTVFAKHEKG